MKIRWFIIGTNGAMAGGKNGCNLNQFWIDEQVKWRFNLKIMKVKPIIAVFAATCLVAGCSKQAPTSLNDRAMAIALNIVSNSLVAPTTAKFSAVTSVERSDNTFLISGKVDSQNSFGAMLRKDFNCVITNNGAGKLTWLGTMVGGDAQINPDFAPKNLELLSSQIVTSRDETSLQPEDHKYKSVHGTVKNISDHTLQNIFITYRLYDGENDSVGSGLARASRTTEPLQPGETWSFETDLFDYKLTPRLEEMNFSP